MALRLIIIIFFTLILLPQSLRAEVDLKDAAKPVGADSCSVGANYSLDQQSNTPSLALIPCRCYYPGVSVACGCNETNGLTDMNNKECQNQITNVYHGTQIPGCK